MHEICNNCRWFDIDDRCRRYPPVQHVISNIEGIPVVVYEWPKVENNDYCGEWRSKHDATHVPSPQPDWEAEPES
jgi:hypothetical protein